MSDLTAIEHAGHVQPITTCRLCHPVDPRDATIATLTEQRDLLRAEVEQLADVAEAQERVIAGLTGTPPSHGRADMTRALLRRLGLSS